ncbi:hypothetical protein ILUMI_09496, partial [Ignelater luminosus]
MDNHESHLAPDVLNIAKENGVILPTILPHTSHKLQALDESVFGPFQNFYNAAVDSWMVRHPGQTLIIYNVAELTGIFPFDRDILTEDEFLTNEMTNRSLTQEAQLQSRNHKTPPIDNQQPSNSRAVLQECENQVIRHLQFDSLAASGTIVGVIDDVQMQDSSSKDEEVPNVPPNNDWDHINKFVQPPDFNSEEGHSVIIQNLNDTSPQIGTNFTQVFLESDSQNTTLNMQLEKLNVEDDLCNNIRSLREKILLSIPSKSTIKKRTECRKYTELIKDLSMQMIGIIKHVKEDLKTKEVEITQLKESHKNLNPKDNTTTNFINHNMNYAEAIKGQYKKPTNFNIKISKLNPKEEKNIKDMLKTEINPKHCNMNIINMKPIKTGDVIIECRNKKDLDKLKLAITTSTSLKCQEIKKRNPRLLLPRIDIDIKKDKLLDVITENNEWLIEKCGGEEYFRYNFTEKFRFGKNENSENIVVEVNGKIRKILLENRINLIWQSIWAEDYLSIQQCYKCFGYEHTQHTCRETKHYCGKCGSTEHKFKECKSITSKCIDIVIPPEDSDDSMLDESDKDSDYQPYGKKNEHRRCKFFSAETENVEDSVPHKELPDLTAGGKCYDTIESARKLLYFKESPAVFSRTPVEIKKTYEDKGVQVNTYDDFTSYNIENLMDSDYKYRILTGVINPSNIGPRQTTTLPGRWYPNQDQTSLT